MGSFREWDVGWLQWRGFADWGNREPLDGGWLHIIRDWDDRLLSTRSCLPRMAATDPKLPFVKRIASPEANIGFNANDSELQRTSACFNECPQLRLMPGRFREVQKQPVAAGRAVQQRGLQGASRQFARGVEG